MSRRFTSRFWAPRRLPALGAFIVACLATTSASGQVASSSISAAVHVVDLEWLLRTYGGQPCNRVRSAGSFAGTAYDTVHVCHLLACIADPASGDPLVGRCDLAQSQGDCP